MGGKRKGNPYSLTDRQIEILRNAAQGMSNVEIGRLIHVTEDGISNHLRLAYRKMGLSANVGGSPRHEAVITGIREGWIPFDPSEKMISLAAERIYSVMHFGKTTPGAIALFYEEPQEVQDSVFDLARAAFGRDPQEPSDG